MKLRETIAKYNMITPGDSVLCALSGGADSVAMLLALTEFENARLAVCHFNHMIRGAESDGDEEFSRNLASELNLPFYAGRGDVPAYCRENNLGVEEGARVLRHAFLAETASKIGAKIALAHTADDRAESVLMNIIRGTGNRGLGSIRPVSGNIIRPLIETSREEIEAYLAERNRPYRTDSTNSDETYTRNKIRRVLLPALKEYNPSILRALTSLADTALEDNDFIESSAKTFIGGRGEIPVSEIESLHPALSSAVIRLMIENVRGNLVDVTRDHIEKIKERADDFVLTLPEGKTEAVVKNGIFTVRPVRQKPDFPEFDIEITPGADILPCGVLTCRIDTRPAKPAKGVIYADIRAIKGALRATNIREGDRMRPFGMKGTKKLGDILTDAKVPLEKRGKLAVIRDDEKIYALWNIRSSEETRIGPDTKEVYVLEINDAL